MPVYTFPDLPFKTQKYFVLNIARSSNKQIMNINLTRFCSKVQFSILMPLYKKSSPYSRMYKLFH